MYIVIRKIGDDLRPAALPDVHETFEEAEAEAARMSNLNIGHEFVVFAPVAGKITLPGEVQNKSYNSKKK